MAEITVEDIRTDDGHEAYVVRPNTAGGSGIIYLHWFDESPNANRTQYLDEAKEVARAGVVSILPQLSFPWNSPPTDVESDIGRIEAEVDYLRRCHTMLTDVVGVDPSRIAVVGHDFGAMHGSLLLGEIGLACAVFVAATPRWSDWFLRFWEIGSDRYDYMRRLSDLDPITAVGRADCPLLFQFAKDDFFIAAMTASELFHAAPDPKTILSYDTDHAMDVAEARTDRIAFLGEHLGFVSSC